MMCDRLQCIYQSVEVKWISKLEDKKIVSKAKMLLIYN